MLNLFLKARFALLVVALTVFVTGCGGGGGSFANQVDGNWSGPFQVYNPNGSVESSGNMTVVFDSFGGAQITLDRTDSNPQTQFINGSLSNDRVLRFVWRWNNTNDRESEGPIRLNGNLLQPDTGDNRIQVTYTGGGIGGMEFTLTRQGSL